MHPLVHEIVHVCVVCVVVIVDTRLVLANELASEDPRAFANLDDDWTRRAMRGSVLYFTFIVGTGADVCVCVCMLECSSVRVHALEFVFSFLARTLLFTYFCACA